MSEQFNLPFGAIAPAAKPVDFFIAPRERNIVQPTQQPMFSAPKGVSTVGTAGTTFVQGSNQFKDLARSLAPFSKALVETLQTAGLQYAAWQMDVGEQAAMEQLAEGQARLDEEMETSELNRAAANREVAYADPQAGGIMDLLNPYRQIGYQRGMSKLAGQEIELGMAGYVDSRSDEIDYNTPDQGFAALQQIRADYTNEVLDKYGVDNGSPGFSKYTAPRIEKASDAVAQTLQKDRVKWLDEQKPRTISALIRNEWNAIQSNGYVMLNGQRYTRGGPGYESAVKARLNQMMAGELMTGGLPGQALKWQEEIFKTLAAERDFEGRPSPLDYLDTSIEMRDANGVVLKDYEGNPRFYSMSEYFKQESIESEVQFAQAAYTKLTRQRKEMAAEVQGLILEKTRGMPAGPQRYAMGEAVLESYILSYERQTGTRMNEGTRSYLYDAWRKANETTLTLSGQMDDPTVVETFVNQVNTSFGSSFNASQLRQMMAQLAGSINDPELQNELFRRGEEAISARETKEDVDANYGSTFRPIVNLEIENRINAEYTRQDARNQAARTNAESQMRVLIEPAIADALRNAEAEKQGRLSQSEAAKVVRDTIKELDFGQIQFPRGNTERQRDREQKELESSISPTWPIDQLADIPNRAAVLRDYRKTRILDSAAIAETVYNASRGYGQSQALKRAWRDAKAESLFDFVESQLKLLQQEVPDWNPPWTPAQWRKFRDRNLRSAGLEKSLYATQRLSETRPQLASIQGWIIPSTFQV